MSALPRTDALRREVPVATPGGAYRILIGAGLMADAGAWAGLPQAAQAVIVSNPTVDPLHGAALRRALAPAGLLLACITGAGTLATLRAVLQEADGDRPAARVHPQIDNQIASGLMARAGFARQVVDSHTLPVTYRSLDRLLADLRLQGLTSVLADAPPPPDDAEMPYVITPGELATNPFDTKDKRGLELFQDIRCYTARTGSAIAVGDIAAYPVASLRQSKYWCPVGRVDNVHGDRNLFCSCVPVAAYEAAAES